MNIFNRNSLRFSSLENWILLERDEGKEYDYSFEQHRNRIELIQSDCFSSEEDRRNASKIVEWIHSDDN